MLKRLSTLLFLLALPAQAAEPLRAYSLFGIPQNTVTSAPLTNVALDASSSAFTINLDAADRNGVYGLMGVWVTIVDASDSTTALTMTCTASPYRGGGAYKPLNCDSTASDSTCTGTAAGIFTFDPSGITSPKLFYWLVDIEGVPVVTCTFTDTGGAAADTLGVYVSFATKGG